MLGENLDVESLGSLVAECWLVDRRIVVGDCLIGGCMLGELYNEFLTEGR